MPAPAVVNPPNLETIRLRLRVKLLQAAMELPAGLALTEPLHVAELIAGGLVLSMTLARREAAGLTEAQASALHAEPRGRCQCDILDLLREVAPRRMTGEEIREALEVRGKLWGESTIKTALPAMCRSGLVYNRHDKSGYGATQHADPAPVPEDNR